MVISLNFWKRGIHLGLFVGDASVGDLDPSIKVYEKAFCTELFRNNPEHKVTAVILLN